MYYSIFLSLPLFFSITDLKFDVALINLSEIIQSLDSVWILRASLKVYWVEWRRLVWVTRKRKRGRENNNATNFFWQVKERESVISKT